MAFLDDIYLVSTSPLELQIMLNELVIALNLIGLDVNAKKVNWTANSAALQNLGEFEIAVGPLHKPCVDYVKVLGSLIFGNCHEIQAAEHGIQASWKCF